MVRSVRPAQAELDGKVRGVPGALQQCQQQPAAVVVRERHPDVVKGSGATDGLHEHRTVQSGLKPRRGATTTTGGARPSLRAVMTPSSRPSLLLLPGGLLVGHGLTALALGSMQHTEGWPAGTFEGLVCLSIPLALAALVHAFLAGIRGQVTPIRWAPLAGLQVALFLVIELIEHEASTTTTGLLVVVAGVVGQVTAAAVMYLLVRGAESIGRRTRERSTRVHEDENMDRRWATPSRVRATVRPRSHLRRGPPVAAT